MYDCSNPSAVFGYIPQESSAQTPRFVQKKKNKLDEIPAKVPEKILFVFNFLNTPMAKIGRINPLHVNKNMFELPMIKSDSATTPKVRIRVVFLFK